jgi:hypothetical protein
MATISHVSAAPLERRWRAAAPAADGRATLERVFRAGRFPAPPPSGLARGTFLTTTLEPTVDRAIAALTTLAMPWLGKAFDPAAGRGENVFAPGPSWYAAGLLRVVPWLGWSIRRDAQGRLRGFPFVTERGAGLADPDVEVLRIVYDDPRVSNPPPVRRVLDEVVEVEPGLLLGKAHMHGWDGRWRLVAFFALRTEDSATRAT